MSSSCPHSRCCKLFFSLTAVSSQYNSDICRVLDGHWESDQDENRHCLCWVQVMDKASSHEAEHLGSCHGSLEAAGIYSLPLLAGDAALKPLLLAGIWLTPFSLPLRE